MALYDNSFEFYDLLMPGSNMTPLLNGSNGNLGTDLMDALGIGTQRRAQEFNANQAKIQREFEERMANTSYQRAVEDLKNAGLNPAMIYGNGGNGAIVPNGASASSNIQNSANILGQAGILINSLTNARSLDNMTTSKIYKDVARIIKSLI